MKILIAEDDRLSRTFLSQFLMEYGKCDIAVDGMQALDFYMDSVKNNEKYDLLCLDIMMPKVDGLKVLKVIRTMEQQQGVKPEDHLPIIMMTAIADTDYVDQAFELGCDAYASKPIEIEKIDELLKSLGIVKEAEK